MKYVKYCAGRVVTRVILSALIVSCATVSAEPLYAVPTGGASCPDPLAMCRTLNEYATNPDTYFTSNSTFDLILLPGEHNLTLSLSVSNITTLFTISAFGLSSHNANDTFSQSPTVTVTCSDSMDAKLTFVNVAQVRISGIRFVGCVGNSFVSIGQLVVEDCEWDGQRRAGTGLELFSVADANITDTNFTSNTGNDITDLLGTSNSVQNGGGAMIANSSTVFISGCLFDGNTARLGGAFYSTMSTITIHSCTFSNEIARDDGGGIYCGYTNLTVYNSTFTNNSASRCGGGIQLIMNTSAIIYNCVFNSNKARFGGGMYLYRTSAILIVIDSTMFVDNVALSGGGIHSSHARLRIVNSSFANNSANNGYGGGMALLLNTSAMIYNCDFSFNEAIVGGGIYLSMTTMVIMIDNCMFINNKADSRGGGISSLNAVLHIENNSFTNNSANEYVGGGIDISSNRGTYYNITSVRIHDCVFTENKAPFGGGIAVISASSIALSGVTFLRNVANIASAFYILFSNLVSDSLLIQNNIANTSIRRNSTLGGSMTVIGSVLAYVSNVTFLGETTFQYNSHSSNLIQGGALASYQSKLVFRDRAVFLQNNAGFGGAIYAIESEIYMYGDVNVSHNKAFSDGGGIFLFQSELNFNGNIEISENRALREGGGIHAVSARTRVTDGFVVLSRNSATRGGGMYLELYAKLYIAKSLTECETGNLCDKTDNQTWIRLDLLENSADYGGALYVADDTNSGTCDSEVPAIVHECFFQFLALHFVIDPNLNIRNTIFTNNSARVAGASLYGGLLDRCTVSSYSELFRVEEYKNLSLTAVDATSAFVLSTNIQRNELRLQLSSESTRVCFCDSNNQPNCNLRPPTFRKRRGEMFNVSLVAVDQVNNTVANASVLGSSKDDVSQLIHKTNSVCKELTYNLVSAQESVVLYLHTNGPCGDTGISRTFITIDFLPCPAGFKINGSECDCDPILTHPHQFVSTCNIDRGMVLRVGNVWISVLNTTKVDEGVRSYLTYTACPFDYCRPSSEEVYIDLNVENGADTQCAFNRSGILCGGCDHEQGLSLSLGSSRCQQCSSNWLALLIPFAIAGVLLVGFLLLCNLTVAVGTIDALIFYANIVGANRATFLPFTNTNVLSVFISWLNLDFGFDTCFYDGFDEYAKQWLQLAFPIYIIFLVAIIIIFCKYSRYFAKLLSKRNPVATLATLILLSFTRLVRTVIAALSFGRIDVHVNGTVETKVVWLFDGNVQYFEGKHVPLAIAAIIVLLVTSAYSVLLFFWQWLLRCPKKKLMRWIRDVRLNSFMDAYNAQFTRQHRYWTGLLLFVRVCLYLSTALINNVFGDPENPLLAIVIVVASLLLLKEFVRGRIYKSRPLNILEGIFLYNLILFAAATLYVRATGKEQKSQIALAYVSTSIAFAMFVFILVYHVYAYLLLSSKTCRKAQESRTIKQIRKVSHVNTSALEEDTEGDRNEPFLESGQEQWHSGDFSKYRGPLDLIDSESLANIAYEPPAHRKCPMVTYSVVDGKPGPNAIDKDIEQSMSEM